MAYYIQEFVVAGSGTFPYDMLRYDGCYPAMETQSAKLSGDCTEKHRLVKLKRYVFSKKDMPTVHRWNSFCWRVDLDSVETRKGS